MRADTRVYVSGHRGMVGSALLRCLRAAGFQQILTRSHEELDLTRQAEVEAFFQQERPEVAVICAARVGGIHANQSFPAAFAQENLAIALNSIHAAYRAGTKRLLFLGSSCIYPREAPQPIPESALLTGPLEPTNEAYALAKIAGVKLCEYYRREYGVCFHAAMPTNLYGPGDNYHPEHSHVIPGLIRRFHDARCAGLPHTTLWGSGTPRREFLHVDDLARALLHLLQIPDPPDLVNVGQGSDITILNLAHRIAATVSYPGDIRLDPSKPDGTPRKLLDSSRLRALGWTPQIGLEEGLTSTYQTFLAETQA